MTTQLPPPANPVMPRPVRPLRTPGDGLIATAVVAQTQAAAADVPAGGAVPAQAVQATPAPAVPIAPLADAPSQVDQLSGIRPLLSRWTGGMATLWTYTVSHGKLVLRFTRPNARGNLHLTCYDCRRISAPTFWGNTTVSVAEEATPEGRRYVIRDEAANVEIRCGHLSAAENVEPVY